MEKVDFKKLMKPYWQQPVGQFVIIEVPQLNFLMVDGRGDPNVANEYAKALKWLFTLSYALKFQSKAAGRDYGVALLEGLWWAKDMSRFSQIDKSDWLWTAMIMQPDWIDARMLAGAMPKAEAKRGCSHEPQAGKIRRGAIGADHACRPLQRRGGDDRATAPRIPAGERAGGERSPSRDLYQRSGPLGAGQAEDGDPPAGASSLMR